MGNFYIRLKTVKNLPDSIECCTFAMSKDKNIIQQH